MVKKYEVHTYVPNGEDKKFECPECGSCKFEIEKTYDQYDYGFGCDCGEKFHYAFGYVTDRNQ